MACHATPGVEFVSTAAPALLITRDQGSWLASTCEEGQPVPADRRLLFLCCLLESGSKSWQHRCCNGVAASLPRRLISSAGDDGKQQALAVVLSARHQACWHPCGRDRVSTRNLSRSWSLWNASRCPGHRVVALVRLWVRSVGWGRRLPSAVGAL